MRYFSLLSLILVGISLLDLGCSNGAKNPASTGVGPVDTLCSTVFRTVPVEEAQKDSTDYAVYINNYPIPETYKITNPRVTHFVIPTQNIDTLVQWKADGKILPNANGNDSTWMMLALQPNKTGSDSTIVPYFACYTSLGAGKKGPIVYFDLSTPGRIITVSAKEANTNIKSMQGYIDNVFNKDTLIVKFYPYGFQFPWKDLEGLACSLRGHLPNNSLNGVLVIREKEVDGHLQKEVDYYLHSFSQRRFAKLSKKKGGDDDGEYFDFVNPCPTSCIP